MPEYVVGGALHDPKTTEGTETISAADRQLLALLTEMRPQIELVAANLAGLQSIPDAVAQANSARDTAVSESARAVQAADSTATRETAASASALLSRTWATQTSGPVEGELYGSRKYAEDTEARAGEIGDYVDQANDAAGEAAGAAQTALQVVETPAGVRMPNGEFGVKHYLDEALRVSRQAAQIDADVLDSGVTSPYVIQAKDLFHGLVVNRSTALELVCPLGLWKGPPNEGYDDAFAWCAVRNRGSGAVTIVREGATGGSTQTFNPTVIAQDSDDFRSTTLGITPTRTLVIDVPAGVSRKVIWASFSTFQGDVSSAAEGARETVFTSAQLTGVAKLGGPFGLGTIAGTQPVLGQLWSGNLADGGAITVNVQGVSKAGVAAQIMHGIALQNCSALAGPAGNVRTGSATTIPYSVTPAAPGSLIFHGAAMLGAGATPITFDRGDVLYSGKTQNTGSPDFGFAFGKLENQPASAQAFVATAPIGTRGTWFGVAASPRTVTVAGGGDGLLKRSGITNSVPTGGQAYVECSSDGETWWLDN